MSVPSRSRIRALILEDKANGTECFYRGTTLRVVEGLLAEMREQPGGSAKGEGLIVGG